MLVSLPIPEVLYIAKELRIYSMNLSEVRQVILQLDFSLVFALTMVP